MNSVGCAYKFTLTSICVCTVCVTIIIKEYEAMNLRRGARRAGERRGRAEM